MMSEDVKKGRGFGYKGKDGKLRMIRCFECGKDNYMPAVESGCCAWCGHDANESKGGESK